MNIDNIIDELWCQLTYKEKYPYIVYNEIDKNRSNNALERAKLRLKDDSKDQARVTLALARAKNRLKVSSR